MRIRPFAELEAYARELYRKRYEVAREAPVINAEAMIRFGAPRHFPWGGLEYRAPPLSFRAGMQLLVAANALRDIRGASLAHPSAGPYAARTAAMLVTSAVRPVHWVARLFPIRSRRTFLRADPLELEGLLRWLLDVPDTSPPPPPSDDKHPPPIDLMDGLAGFARDLPAWIGADGFPRSWAHYVYGMRHLSRAKAREDLRTGQAVRLAGAESVHYTNWATEMRAYASW